jgi:hypothetical protein
MSRFVVLSACFIGALVPAAFADCDRAALATAVDHYVSTRSTGLTSYLPFLADTASYVENNKQTDIKSGLLSQSMTLAHNRSTIDTVACATYTELIVTDPAKSYVIGTQIHYAANDSMKATLVDSVVSTTGSWQFNASKTLSYVLKEDWGTIPADKRDTRAAILAAADAYLDLWGDKSKTTVVPWGTPCDRLEGSAYTGKGTEADSCNVGIPNGNYPPNTERRYVIDETVGSANVLCVFQTMRNAPDSHEFRLEGGKLRYVHTMTVCACGQPQP